MTSFQIGDKVIYTGHTTNPAFVPAQPGAVGIVKKLSVRPYSGKSVPFLGVFYKGSNRLYTLGAKKFRLLVEDGDVRC